MRGEIYFSFWILLSLIGKSMGFWASCGCSGPLYTLRWLKSALPSYTIQHAIWSKAQKHGTDRSTMWQDKKQKCRPYNFLLHYSLHFITITHASRFKCKYVMNLNPHPSLRKHSADSMFNNPLRNSLLELVKRFHCHSTGSSWVPPIELLGPLVTRYCNFFSIHLFVSENIN